MRDGESSDGWMGPGGGAARGQLAKGWLGGSLRCRSVAGERPFAQEGRTRCRLQGRAGQRAELS